MKDVVNTKIKFREPYRPFAPSVLAERTEDFFELRDAIEHDAARFMLLVTPIRPEKRDLLPAITHVDGTGRLQTVFEDTNPLYYRLIQRFGESTGVPVVLNTSFNLRGEPIVTTPANAYSTFRRSEMDLLVMGSYLVTR
jgi:carbamoyltransferase